MAKVELFIPFILHFAAGLSKKSLSLPLEQQFELARKSGWSNHPADPGGPTMIDITLSTFSSYRLKKGMPTPTQEELKGISFPEWKDILKSLFWNRCSADKISSQGLANIIVDWVWASGPSVLIRLQNILGVSPDGIIGPQSLAAINRADTRDQLFLKIRNNRDFFYRNCRNSRVFLKGWLRRLYAINPDGSFSL